MDRRDFLTMGPPRTREAIRGESHGTIEERGGAQTPPAFARRSATDLTPYGGAWTWEQAAHLLRRGMIGPTEAEIRRAVTEGMAATLERLFTPFDPALGPIAEWAESTQFQIGPDAAKGEDAQTFQMGVQLRREGLINWINGAIVGSPVSMQERLRLFWHNHFTTELDVINFPEIAYEQYRLFARQMLGNFKQFVYDVTVDMAMLIYLDGVRNYKAGTRSNINENYARELMELFTMGVFDWDGRENYTQEDVSNAARALSGWNYNVDLANPRGYTYIDRAAIFKPLLWDIGQKTLMGRTGQWDAQDVIDIIFEERADQIAKFVCEKIYRGFVFDVPDRVVVGEMADLLRAGDWELRPVFEALLGSTHFYDETNIGAMHRSPIDYVVGTARSLELTNIPGVNAPPGGRTTRDLAGRLQSLGQLPYAPPNVKGWPGGRTWTSTSTLPVRQKLGIDVAAGNIVVARLELYAFDPLAFARQFTDPEDIHLLSDEMARALLNVEPSEPERTMLYETLLDGGRDYEWSLEDPEQKPDERIRKFLGAVAQLAKFQLS